MQKSSPLSKITGNFGEALILNWLSKRGFECAHVDHTAIDLIARRPSTAEVLGVSVKCRSRTEALDESGVNLTGSKFATWGSQVSSGMIANMCEHRASVIRIIGAGYWRKGKAIYERENQIYE